MYRQMAAGSCSSRGALLMLDGPPPVAERKGVSDDPDTDSGKDSWPGCGVEDGECSMNPAHTVILPTEAELEKLVDDRNSDESSHG